MEGEVQERVAKIEEAVERANAAHNARKEALLAKTRKIEEDKKSAAARSGHQSKNLLDAKNIISLEGKFMTPYFEDRYWTFLIHLVTLHFTVSLRDFFLEAWGIFTDLDFASRIVSRSAKK